MNYEEPEVEIIRFEDEDVITASDAGLPIDESAFNRVLSSDSSLFACIILSTAN